MFIRRDEIEEAILHNKDIASKGNFTLVMPTEKKPFTMTETKETFTMLPSTVSTSRCGMGPMETHSRSHFEKKTITEPTESRINKDRPMPESTQSKMPGFEGMTHYQG